MKHVTPLRYPGGKARLWKYIASVLHENDCVGGCYAEPYAGGAGIALQLLEHDYVNSIYLNDLNKGVYAFWHSILNHGDRFCEQIDKIELSVTEWRRQKEIQKQQNNSDKFSLGFSLFYLNRTNRSGIINAGVIGGLQQAGAWKLDARFNRQNLIDRVQTIVKYKKRIKIFNLDAEKFLKTRIVRLPENTLIYLDPPYYEKGYQLYDNFYKPDDHARLASLLKTDMREKKWLVSYDNVANIGNLYGGLRQENYSLSYSVNKYRLGSELMIFSDNTHAGDIDNKLHYKAKAL